MQGIMGLVSSCYPNKSQSRVAAATQPFDTRRLLSELITVQTAIVLNEDATNERKMMRPPGVIAEESEQSATDVQQQQQQKTPQLTPQRQSVRESRRRSVEYTITSKTSMAYPGDLNATTITTTSAKSDLPTLSLNQATDKIVGAHVAAHNHDVQKASNEADGRKMPSINEMKETSVW